MMYEKACLFDPDLKLKILSTHSPKDIKALGRAVKNFNEGTEVNTRLYCFRKVEEKPTADCLQAQLGEVQPKPPTVRKVTANRKENFGGSKSC